MKSVDIFAIKGSTKKDDKAILSCNRKGIEMTIDEYGRVYNEGGQYIADAEEVENGNGIGCNAHGGKREGSGRPTLEEDEVRKNHSIKFTDYEWEVIKLKAGTRKKNRSDYIREKALE